MIAESSIITDQVLSIRDFGRKIYLSGSDYDEDRLPTTEMLFVLHDISRVPILNRADPNVGKLVGSLKPVYFSIIANKGLSYEFKNKYSHFNVLEVKHEVFRDVYKSVRQKRVPYLHITRNEAAYIFMPEFFDKHKRKRALRIVSFDIEVLSDGITFPRYDKNPVIAIGFYDGENYYTRYIDSIDEIGEKEPALLKYFFNFLYKYKPDILVGYNSKDFDLKYLIQRALLLGLEEYVSKVFRVREVGNEFLIYPVFGTVHYDLWPTVMEDQSLSGKVPDRKLETIAEYYGLDTIRLYDHDMRKIIGTEMLKEYHKNDIKITYDLAINYLPTSVNVAEILNVPLESILDSYPAFVPRIFSARILLAGDEVCLPLYSNNQKYSIDGKIYKLFGPKLWGKYRAAYVDVKRTGYYENVKKIDFSSYYPTTMMTLNIGADTTRIVKVEPYCKKQTDKILAARKGDKLYLKIFETNINKTIYIEIDQSKRSGFYTALKTLYDARKKVKSRLKTISDPSEKKVLKARQNAIKVIMNSIYGINGLKNEKYGDLSVAMATVGYARDLSLYVTENLIADNVIEIDTDGFYVFGDIDVDEINDKIREYVQNKYGIKEIYTLLSLDEFDSIYVRKMKTYVLRNKDGTYELHGSGFVNSKNAPIQNDAIWLAIKHVFEGLDISDLEKFLHELHKQPNSKFVQYSSVRDTEEYKSKTSLSARLSQKYKEKTKLSYIPHGTKVFYVFVREGDNIVPHVLLESEVINIDKMNLNIAYDKYREYVLTAWESFGIKIDDSLQQKLF